jgi:hypothetical protein
MFSDDLFIINTALEKIHQEYKDLNCKWMFSGFCGTIDGVNFYNSKIQELKQTLTLESKNIKNIATQVKILEISKYLTELDKNSRVDDSHLIDLLQYYELIKEIRLANGVQI